MREREEEEERERIRKGITKPIDITMKADENIEEDGVLLFNDQLYK